LFIQKSRKNEKAEKRGTAEKERKKGGKAEEVATLVTYLAGDARCPAGDKSVSPNFWICDTTSYLFVYRVEQTTK
jgi:hypothetical protein